MAKNWNIVPEEFTNWHLDEYEHLTDEDLSCLRKASVLTSPRCTDPGKRVIKREWLVCFLNEKLIALGMSLEDYEVCPRTLSQFILDFSASSEHPRLTISSSSKNKYILLENGAAAAVCEFVLSNLGKIEAYRQETIKDLMSKMSNQNA